MNINKIIQNLSNLSKLDIQDLKNIDYKTAALNLLKRKDSLLVAALIIISIGGMFYIHMSNAKLTTKLKIEVGQLEEKIKTVATFTQIKDDLKKFLEQFPEGIPADKLVEALNDFAISNNVEILTFSPVDTSDRGLFTISTIKVTVFAQSYENTWQFLQTIEKAPLALRVDNWDGGPHEQRERNSSTTRSGIKSNIQFSTIILK